MKNTSLINRPRGEIVKKNSQGAYVSKNDADALAQTIKNMFASNGIEYEVYQATSKERSPEASIDVKLKLGFTWKTTTVTKLIPRGGIFVD
mgnify:CR=1 FL=1